MILHDPDTGKAVTPMARPKWQQERDKTRARRVSKASRARWEAAGGSRGIRALFYPPPAKPDPSRHTR